MKLIIDIDEKEFNFIKQVTLNYEAGIIAHGIPLTECEDIISKSVLNDIKQERYNQGFVDGYKNSYDRGHTVINDIKAEIEQTANEEADEVMWSRGLHYALKIIDEHLAESENK